MYCRVAFPGPQKDSNESNRPRILTQMVFFYYLYVQDIIFCRRQLQTSTDGDQFLPNNLYSIIAKNRFGINYVVTTQYDEVYSVDHYTPPSHVHSRTLCKSYLFYHSFFIEKCWPISSAQAKASLSHASYTN